MGVQKGSKIVIDGLVACWDFSSKVCYGGSGSTCSDLAARNIGTLSTPTFVNDGIKSAFVFDASNTDTINIQDTPSLNFGTGDFSVEAWFYVTGCESGGSDNMYPGVFLSDGNGLTYDGYGGGGMSANHFKATVCAEGYTHSYTPELPFDTWHCVVATRTGVRDSSTGKNTYVNGEGPYTGAGNGDWGAVTEFQMGRAYSTHYVDGDIAIVRVYNRVLTLAEIKTNYDQAKGRFQ